MLNFLRLLLPFALIPWSMGAELPYGGFWAVRIESDVKVSASWMAAWPLGDSLRSHVFIQPMAGLAGSAVYLGYGQDLIARDGESGRMNKYDHFHIRPKVGILRSYNKPNTIEDHEWYGYAGVELSLSSLVFGLNGHVGVLVGEQEYWSAGIGYGF